MIVLVVDDDENSRVLVKTIFTAFFFLFGGWILTIFDGFYWKDTINFLEHLCYAFSSLSLAIWTWRVFASKGASRGSLSCITERSGCSLKRIREAYVLYGAAWT